LRRRVGGKLDVPKWRVKLNRPKKESDAVTENTEDVAVAKANLVEHLKNIDAACDDARLSNLEKIRRIKEEVEKAQDCLKRVVVT
jgi:hypothetical protein